MHYSIKKINRKIQKLEIAFKNKESNMGFKFKNDNGPINVFIMFYSKMSSIHLVTRSIRYSYYVDPFVSNENKKFTWYVFWIDPVLIRYVEKAT